MIKILFIIMWLAAAVSIISGILPFVPETNIGKQIMIFLIVLIGAPFMLITQGIEIILDSLLNEGWNDDDDDKFG